MFQITLNIESFSHLQMIDITRNIEQIINENGLISGLCHVYIPHTTAGVTINEGADPNVQQDILRGLDCMVPSDIKYRHMEGNSRSHIMASLIGSSVSVVVHKGQLQLGT